MNQTVIIKPKFWQDALWFYPAFMLIIGIGFSVFMWRLSRGESYWFGLSFIMNLIMQPIFLLLWIDSLSNRAIFEEDQLIIKGSLHKKKILYKDIKELGFSDLQPAYMIYFNQKLGKNMYERLFIWNYSINIFIDEVKKRTNLAINGYPTKINKMNFNGKIWFIIIMALTLILMNVAIWNADVSKPQDTTIVAPK